MGESLVNVSPNHVLYPLLKLAQEVPDRQILSFVDDHGKDSETRTVSDLVKRIEQLSIYLREGCELNKGDVVLLVYPPSIEFIEAFAACMVAGIVAAPVYPPNLANPESDLIKLKTITERSGAKAILTNRSYRWGVRLSSAKSRLNRESGSWPDLPWFVTQGIGWYKRGHQTQIKMEIEKDDLAVLQFTSGSTSAPKGVRLTHKNLCHQLNFNAETLNMDGQSRFVMWVPQYHDLGLISGILSVLRGNGQLWFMSPLSFLKQPAVWFDTIHRVRGTHTAAPNFGYELITRKTTPEIRSKWNLSCLKILMSAAEPIIPKTMDQFFSAFQATGLSEQSFCPAYGLAEHTVGVTIGGRRRLKINRKSLVDKQWARLDPSSGDLEVMSCGVPGPGVQVRIVCPNSKLPLKETQVGEIWVQSESVADGYEGLETITQTTFKETIPGESGTWLRTGDLGFFYENELFVTGRQKDLIILQGRNYHPEDLEEAIRNVHPSIRPGGVAAFSIPGSATEQLVVIVEVVDSDPSVRQETIRSIRQRISEVWKVQATIGLVPPKSVKKTTSGKIQRSACRQAWLDNHFELLEISDVRTQIIQPTQDRSTPDHSPEGHPSLVQQLGDLKMEDRIDALVEVIIKTAQTKFPEGITHLGIDDPLIASGLDSLATAELIILLEEAVGRTLPATLFIEQATLRGVAMRILNELEIEHLGFEPPVSAPAVMPFRPPHRGMVPAQTRIAIIGGGVGGLISALELARIGYKNIVIFEESNRCGGKVKTAEIDGERIELGQQFFADSFQTMLKIAREMQCEIIPYDTPLSFWDQEFGYEASPARSPFKKWVQSLFRASRVPNLVSLPFPSMTENLDRSFTEFLKEKNFDAVHPFFAFDWNAMGYGLDTSGLASYVIPYLQVVGNLTNSCLLKNGNQELWTKLAEHLEKTWGVSIRYQSQMEQIKPDNEGVTLVVKEQELRFDEVILAVSPHIIEKMLPPSDPLQEILSQFEYYGYSIISFKIKEFADTSNSHEIFKTGCRRNVFFPTLASKTGKPIFIGACHQHQGWFISGHFSANHSRKPEFIHPDELKQEIIQVLTEMGAEVDKFGPENHWTYFPHLRENASQQLRKAEALQGTRHIWTTGAWISFETTEHVARHAEHLIQTCFEPSESDDRPVVD